MGDFRYDPYVIKTASTCLHDTFVAFLSQGLAMGYTAASQSPRLICFILLLKISMNQAPPTSQAVA